MYMYLFCCGRKKNPEKSVKKYKTVYIEGKYYVFLSDSSDNYIEI